MLVDIGKAQVAARFRHARGAPFKEVLRRKRPLGVDLQLRRNLVARQVQFLGLDPWQGQCLALVQGGLAVGDAVDGAGPEQRLAPVDGVTAQAGLEWHVAQVVLAEHEGIHPFGGRALIVAVGIATQPGGRGAAGAQVVGGGDAVVVQVARIGGVVPECGTDPSAVLAFVDDVRLAEDIQAVVHQPVLVEVAVAVIVVRVRQDRLVLPFGTHAQVVAQGVVPAQLKVVVAGIDLDRSGAAAGDGAHGHDRCPHGMRTGGMTLIRFVFVIHLGLSSPGLNLDIQVRKPLNQ
ncbi:hypothetical protein D3C77_202340 [compost metagenome]